MAATTPAANPLDQPIVPHPTDPNYVPDFVHHENQNNLAIGVLTTCAAISTICVFLRFYGRVMLLRKVQAEEGTLFLLLLLLLLRVIVLSLVPPFEETVGGDQPIGKPIPTCCCLSC